MKVEPPALGIRFGVFEADLRSGELRRQGVKIRLQEQPFQALALLLERPGHVVTREELRSRLWPADTFVDFDRGLNKAINKLRDALGDSAESPRFIETLPQRGYRFIAPVELSGTGILPVPGQGSQPRRASWRRWLLALTASVGIAAASLLLILGLNAGGIRERLITGQSQQRIWSIAVLPFENISGDPAQEYFAVGMTEELIGELARIGSGVRVISRTSSMQFKGTRKSLPAIAQELGADAIVEGTALRAGNKVRITAQLIDARRDVHLWSGRYERDLSDVLILQGEVAQTIAGQISVKLAPAEQAVFARSRRVNPQAFEAVLSGAFLFDRPTEPRLSQAIEHFSEAIRHDPAYARAYAGIARAHVFMGIFRFRPPSEAFASARAAAGKALELDETLAEAHTALAEIKKNDSDWAGAEAAYRRALDLNPSYSLAHTW